MNATKPVKIMLVYQAGIANVFTVDRFTLAPKGRNARRLLQHAFSPCVWFVRGLAASGAQVKTVHCNEAGDIAERPWSTRLDDAPFSNSSSFAIVNRN